MFKYLKANSKKVKSIQFSILSPDIIKNMSVVHINNYENNPDINGSLSDKKLGATKKYKCETCKLNYDMCPGHFGHIILNEPVYNILFFDMIYNILRVICFNCSNLLINKEMREKILKINNLSNRINYILEYTKNIKFCSKCNFLQPKYRKLTTNFTIEFKEDTNYISNSQKRLLKASEVLLIFKNISLNDLNIIGFNPKFSRPEWFIITILPVPSLFVRPSITLENGTISQNELTHKLSDIIKINNIIKEEELFGRSEYNILDLIQLLQFHISTMMNNKIDKDNIAINGVKPFKSISERISGKEGRMRGNIMGKRVDFSARTVIGGDPTLSIDEVGVPRSMAMTLTVPEIVQDYNINYLQKLVDNGPNILEGANYVYQNNKKINLLNNTNIKLNIGDIVERHAKNGDIGIFNRQPSLHKTSMMGHKVKILPYSILRMNLAITTPYNADFDGDEMNFHLLQTQEARSECRNLMIPQRHIISAQSNSPSIGLVQDSLLASMKFTKDDILLDKQLVCNILMWIKSWNNKLPKPIITEPKELWSGKQIFSLLLPNNINYKNKTNSSEPKYKFIEIINGILKNGILDKNTVGQSSNSLIHIIYNDYGPLAVSNFINDLQLIVNYWLIHNGASIGLSDMIVNDYTNIQIKEIINKANESVISLVNNLKENKLQGLPGMTIEQVFESMALNKLNVQNDIVKIIINSLPEFNNLKQMMESGSKGKALNMFRIIGCVGQQNIKGQRVEIGFIDRTLPYYERGDMSIESRGFIKNSYINGLNPREFFFHAMSGREGITDTAVKTAESGYIYRRLGKALEHLITNYDGSVRNALNDIVQFLYGDDGLDAIHIEKQDIDLLSYNKNEFDNIYKWNNNKFHNEYNTLLQNKNLLKTIFINYNKNIYLPINIKRLILNAKNNFDNKLLIKPEYVIEQVNLLCDNIKFNTPNKILQNLSTTLLKINIRSSLASKRVIYEYKLSKNAFDYIIHNIQYKYDIAFSQPGEMVGILAAQSIGEPITQMTLNTFHSAGASGANVTLGVPRLEEILNVRKNIKTPYITAYLNNITTENDANILRNKIELTSFNEIIVSKNIYDDPNILNSIFIEDREFINAHFEYADNNIINFLSSKMIRFVFNKDIMIKKGIRMNHIYDKISNDQIYCIFNNDYSNQLVMQIRIINYDSNFIITDKYIHNIENTIINTILKGISNINRVFIQNLPIKLFDDNDNIIDKNEWTLQTDGTNLLDILGLQEINSNKTISNDIVEVYNILGIEAARQLIINELDNVITSYVNKRHIKLLADRMTYRGLLFGINRIGMNQIETGPLLKSAFEQPVEIFAKAAIFSENDNLCGPSENIIIGNYGPFGSGIVDLLVQK